jgi:hypothetical protein
MFLKTMMGQIKLQRLKTLSSLLFLACLGVSPADNTALQVAYGPQSEGFRLGIRDDASRLPNADRVVGVFLASSGASEVVDNGALIADATDAFQFIDVRGNVFSTEAALQYLGSFGPPKYVNVSGDHTAKLAYFLVHAYQKLSPGTYSLRLQLPVKFKDGTSVTLTSGTVTFQVADTPQRTPVPLAIP